MRSAMTLFLVLVGVVSAGPVRAQHGGVASTVHNLSASGPGTVRALSETEVCKFCHVPHNARAAEALWSQTLSNAQYTTPTVRRGPGDVQQVPQPDGSSRLCLSCHDGTVAVGDVAGEPRPIDMAGGAFLSGGRRGHLGTDLSGGHPVSFVVRDDVSLDDTGDRDMGLRPLATIRANPDVRLDDRGKMQCTTCHDPHDDTYFVEGVTPRFWVRPTVTEVCVSCHELR